MKNEIHKIATAYELGVIDATQAETEIRNVIREHGGEHELLTLLEVLA